MIVWLLHILWETTLNICKEHIPSGTVVPTVILCWIDDVIKVETSEWILFTITDWNYTFSILAFLI